MSRHEGALPRGPIGTVTPLCQSRDMAAVFDLDDASKGRARELVDLGLDTIQVGIDSLSPRGAVAELARAQRRLAGIEADLLAQHVTADGDARAAERLLGDGKTSRKEQRRKSRRAKANANSDGKLGDKLASGELSEEQADLIADADDQSDGEAATDDDFVDAIAGADPDRGRGIRDDWLAARKNKDDVQSEHDRQRALRRMQAYTSRKHGLGVTSLEGDSIAHRNMVEAIRARADEIYRRDGGRDVASGDHLRTQAQREFDAAYELVCGARTTPSGTTAPPTTDAAPSKSSAARPQIVVALTIDKLLGRDPASMATQIGLGLIPDSVLADYAEHADIIAALFDASGEQLWQRRLRRHATAAQFIALTIRDRGCVLCGASHTRCEAHHLMPWNAPAKGESNLDEMALLCGLCHRRLHDDGETLYRNLKGSWVTRPATPDEIPLNSRRNRPGRGTRPQRE